MSTSRLPWHLLALLVVAIWGITFVSTKTLISAGLDPAEIFLVRFSLAYAGIWILALASRHPRDARSQPGMTSHPVPAGPGIRPLELFRSPVVWGNLLFLGLCASLLCFVIWNLVMSRLGNITSTNYVYLNPVFTLITATILLGGRLTPAGAVGSALILLGVILAGQRDRRPRDRSKKIW